MVLVTGSEGFIGQKLVEYLEKQGKTVICIDRKSDEDVFEAMRHAPWDEIEIVYHFGAISSTTEVDVALFYEFNIKFSIDLFTLASWHKIPIRYASSASVYGNSDHNEPNPLNFYALSKLTVDYWVRDYLWGNDIIGYRMFNVYGEDESMKPAHTQSPVYKFTQQAKKNGKILVFKGSETILRDFVCVEDVVQVIIDGKPKFRNMIYDLGTSNPVSFLSVASRISEKHKAKIKFIPFPEYMRDGYQFYTRADNHFDHKFKSVPEWLETH
jgi:ADP-L-glycero-D-manno-heptose 6-epimerase